MDGPRSILKLEFMTGTPIVEVLSEMKHKAKQFDVAYVESRINNVDIFISQNASIQEAFNTYQQALKDKKDFIVL